MANYKQQIVENLNNEFVSCVVGERNYFKGLYEKVKEELVRLNKGQEEEGDKRVKSKVEESELR